MTAYTRKAFWGFMLILAGSGIVSILNYLLRLVLARGLTVAEYGLVYAVMALFGVVAIFNNLGQGYSIMKFVSEFAAQRRLARMRDVILSSSIILYISAGAIAILAIFLADFLSTAYFHNDLARVLIILYALATILGPINYIVPSVFLGFQRMGLKSGYEVTKTILIFGLTALAIFLGFGAVGAIAAYSLSFAVLHVFFMPILNFGIVPRLFAARKIDLGKVLKFGLPITVAGIASTVFTYTDTLLLTYFDTLENVGLYQVAVPTSQVLLIFTGVLLNVLMPLVSELWAKKKDGLIQMAVGELYKYVFLAIVPLVIAFEAYPGVIINLLFGGEYIAAAPILQVLALASVFLIINTINGSTLAGIGVPKEYTVVVVWGAAVNLVANLILIPAYGPIGAALATLLSAIVILLLSFRKVSRRIVIRLPLAVWAKSLVAGGVFFGVMVLFRLLPAHQYVKASLSLVVGGAVYLALLFILRAITLDEVRGMVKRILAQKEDI